jgi:hypothetical protein
MLKGASMYLFTDNFTVEGALFKGNTPSQKLYNLIVRFQKVQISCDADIIVSHVAVTRMMAQGTDGFSQGLLTEGVNAGLDMLSFFPLQLNAIERSPSVLSWVISWLVKMQSYYHQIRGSVEDIRMMADTMTKTDSGG